MARPLLCLLAAAALAASPARAETVRVSAAASLTEAFQEIARAFAAAHAGDAVELNFAGSNVLRAQIEQGAPVDVFASADLVHAEALTRAGLLGPTQVFARNRLVIAVPAARAKVGGLRDLAHPGTKIVLAAPAVPAGRYAAEAIARISADRLYGDDYGSRVMANVVSHESNVRAVLAKVSLGEADAGVVYATDAAAAKGKVRAIEIPERWNAGTEYALGIVAASRRPAKARAFVDFALADHQGRAILARHGFGR